MTQVIFSRRFWCKSGGKATGNQQKYFCCILGNMNLWYHWLFDRGQILVNAGLNPLLRAIWWYWQVMLKIQVETKLNFAFFHYSIRVLIITDWLQDFKTTHYSYEMTYINKVIALSGWWETSSVQCKLNSTKTQQIKQLVPELRFVEIWWAAGYWLSILLPAASTDVQAPHCQEELGG